MSLPIANGGSAIFMYHFVSSISLKYIIHADLRYFRKICQSFSPAMYQQTVLTPAYAYPSRGQPYPYFFQ